MTQSHDEFLDFYAKSRVQNEEKRSDGEASSGYTSQRFNRLLLPILSAFGHRTGDRVGAKDHGFRQQVGSELFFNETPRPYDKPYGVDFEIPEKKKKVKQSKTALGILSEVMQREGKQAKNMFEHKVFMNGQTECSFRFEGRTIAKGVGRSQTESKKQCAANVLSVFKYEPTMKPRFGAIVTAYALGLKMSKKKGGGKEKAIGRGRWSSVSVDHRAQSAQCRYELVVVSERKAFAPKAVDVAVDELYLERWHEFEARGHEIPTHCHRLLDGDGRRVFEIDAKTECVGAVKTEQDSSAKMEHIAMPPPHSKLMAAMKVDF